MSSITLQSRSYGIDPMKALEIKQSQQANEQRREARRPTLSLKPRDGGWSEARKRAEELFSLPRPVLEP